MSYLSPNEWHRPDPQREGREDELASQAEQARQLDERVDERPSFMRRVLSRLGL